jgi:hypothetical protein
LCSVSAMTECACVCVSLASFLAWTSTCVGYCIVYKLAPRVGMLACAFSHALHRHAWTATHHCFALDHDCINGFATTTTHDPTDVAHLPTGCATWPAWWLVGPSWPSHGEIDVVEGVHTSVTNTMTLHTSDGCTQRSVPDSKFSGKRSTGKVRADHVLNPFSWDGSA